jgi:hypothetical protein
VAQGECRGCPATERYERGSFVFADIRETIFTGRSGIRGTRQGISALSSLVWIPSAVWPIMDGHPTEELS